MPEFELVTADFDEDDPTDRDGSGDSDWTSKIVWNNYGSCRIEPNQSGEVRGIRVSARSATGLRANFERMLMA